MPKRILIVEDDPEVRQILSDYLTGTGREIVFAVDGEEGLAKFEQIKPDLVVLDVILPKMSGYDFLKQLKARGKVKTPIIVTSYKEEMKNFFEPWDIVDFLPKPFGRQEFMAKVQEAIGVEGVRFRRGKRVIVITVSEFFKTKLYELLDAKDCTILEAIDAKDAVEAAHLRHPNLVLCEFPENRDVLDPIQVYEALKAESGIKQVPFYVCTPEDQRIEADRFFKNEQIIEFRDTPELSRKLDKILD